MGLKSFSIVKIGKQESSPLNLTYQDQEPWMSPSTTTSDLYRVPITLWDMDTVTRLVMKKELVLRSSKVHGKKKDLVL